MKLIVQIPCLNEEKTLPETVKAIPRHIQGVSEVKVLVVDDGSSDHTVQAAKKCGVDHVLRFTNHKGLAKAFTAGIETSLRLGADIIVNTDADNQYQGADIPKLIQPILEGSADMVIGVRNLREQKEFSFVKKCLQKMGSWVVRKLSGTKIKDTTSGFRAYSREAAVGINVISEYSYTLETIIQAGRMGIAIEQVPIRTNSQTRESRLFKSTFSYLVNSIGTILKVYAIYRPIRVFFSLGLSILGAGILIGCRFFYFYFSGNGGGHVQSLILASILIMLGFQVCVLGLLANLISANRFLIENVFRNVQNKIGR